MAHPDFQEMLRSLLRSGMKQSDIAAATGYAQSSVKIIGRVRRSILDM